jgi:phosphate transport system substrate-binding protein
MFKTKAVFAIPVAALLGGVLAAGAPAAFGASPVVTLDGSSTVYPISEAVAEEFQKHKKGDVKVTVGISGTGGGFKKFCRGEIDISDASRPIKKSEMEDCAKAGIKYIELPIAYDALTVVVHPQNTWAKTLTVADLKKIWEPDAQGKITNWNQVRADFPDVPLKLYGPGTDSGTFEYFTEAIVGKAKASRSDYTASEDDNTLVTGVSRDKGGLGYFGYAYYAENTKKLAAASIDGGKGPVAPSEKSVEDGSYTPLARPVFIYVSEKALEKPEVKEFVDFYMKNAPKLVKEVKYVPLPASIYAINTENVNKKKLGTVFGGKSDVGLKVEDLVKKEASL